jgi:hypothetical protein
MAYTKYSLTPANNNAAPPDGAPEGMLPSAVNDTMRDMMAQIRDVGDGIRGGTYTMTAPVITGGSITGVALSGNTLTNPVITGGSINNTTVGATTRSTGAFTTLASNGATTFTAGTASTSTTTGTAVITGGLGVSGRINAANFDGIVGANTAAAGNFTTLGATGVATFSAGTVSAPAITTTGDTNTGIFFPAADTIAFTEGGVESMRINSSGNLGLGATNPTDRLTIQAAAGTLALNAQTTAAGNMARFSDGVAQTLIIGTTVAGLFYNNANSGHHAWQIGGSEQMRLNSTGLGIGTSSPNAKFVVSNSGAAGFEFNPNVSGVAQIEAYNRSTAAYVPMSLISDDIRFRTGSSATERMRIDSSGKVGIGTSSPLANRLHIVNASAIGGVPAAGTYGGPVIIGNDSTAYGLYVGTIDSGAGYLQTQRGDSATTYNLLLQPNGGNVGIGVVPSAALTPRLQIASTFSAATASAPYNGLLIESTDAQAADKGGVISLGGLYDASSGVTRFAAIAGLKENGTSGNFAGYLAFYSRANGSAPAERMRIDSSGNVGIGTNSPADKLNVVGNIRTTASGGNFYQLGADATGGYLYSNQSTAFLFYTGGAERMRITSGGSLLVGNTTSFGFRFQSICDSGESAALFYRQTTTGTDNLINGSSDVGSSGATRFVVLASGNVQNTNNSYGALSDIKVKENIVDATPKLDKLMQVKVRNYNLKTEPNHKQIGVIAQELEEVFPSMVEETPDKDKEGNDLGTTTKSVKYSVFVPMLIKAIQEQQALITSLTARIAALESN